MTPDQPQGDKPAGADQPPAGPYGSGVNKDGPRIHVDTDWKKQAQAEKERLAREAESAAAAKAAGAARPAGPEIGAEAEIGDRLPQASFATLVQTLATQAAIFMSDQADPETGESVQNLELAKHNIDLLRVLEEKTKGNLTDDEKRLLETLLYELLMAYVSAAS
jgi:hypothetical protein